MPQIIPLEPSEAFYRFSTTLEDTDYIFNVRWNGRDAAWYFDLFTIDDVLIAGGNKIVLGAYPGARSASADMPPGVFIVSDTSDAGLDATYEDLGVRVVMHYYTVEEFIAL